MSLDVYLTLDGKEVYESNITHNLNRMAEAAGIYKDLWRPEEIGIETASQLIDTLEQSLTDLVMNPTKYKQYDAPNGWGKWEHFVRFVAEYLEACRMYPDAQVMASR